MLNSADTVFLEKLGQALPPGTLRPVEPRYLEEPRGRYQGQAASVLRPACVEDVSVILRMANEACVPVIPYAGGTGLVGGQLWESDVSPLLLSLERMDTIRSVDPVDNSLICDAGVILADIQAAAADVDRLFPLSLASEGSCRIGGNLATNAGGLNVLRYGNARDLCLGLEVVLADGTIVNGLKRLRKDNTGYDLRHLMIGSEGTLGVITGASLSLFPRPKERGTAIVALSDLQASLLMLNHVQDKAGSILSAFELIGEMGFSFLQEIFPHLRIPQASLTGWTALIDLGGQNADATLETVLSMAFKQGIIRDAVIAKSEAQRQEIWSLREQIPQANRAIGSIVSNDISVPVSAIPDFIMQTDQALSALDPNLRINAFGHLGDGNLHYNIFPPRGGRREDYDALRQNIKEIVMQSVIKFEGSLSAEHGIGRLKVADLMRFADPGKLSAMRAIKAALDPKGILNPGAVLPV